MSRGGSEPTGLRGLREQVPGAREGPLGLRRETEKRPLEGAGEGRERRLWGGGERERTRIGFFTFQAFIWSPKVGISGEAPGEGLNRVLTRFQVCPPQAAVSTDWLAPGANSQRC